MPVDETDIRQWADRHQCRSHLPILIRRLIRETTTSLSAFRFPGNEAVDLSGLDGFTESESGTVWVPQGPSVWEMGCNMDPSSKASTDFEKRTSDTPKLERAKTNFIFVTPRRWNQKVNWLEQRRKEAKWQNVIAFDAVDIESWLEEAPVTSRWFGELIGKASEGLLTPHEWWQRWSSAALPAISIHLVATRRDNESVNLLKSLRGEESVISIKADDRSEAVAFVIAALIEANALDLLDRVLVAISGGFRVPMPGASRMILITDLPEGEDPNYGDRRNITLVRAYSRGRLDVHDALQLSHVPTNIFRSELESMGYSNEEATSLALKTGHSIPVLRRQLSRDPEIRL